jgi:hypothetical protein
LDFVDIDPENDLPLFVDPFALTVRKDEWSAAPPESVMGPLLITLPPDHVLLYSLDLPLLVRRSIASIYVVLAWRIVIPSGVTVSATQ